MESISASRVLGLLGQDDTGLRVGDGSENLLRTMCVMLGLRKQSKTECDQLRLLLLELAARGRVQVEFESDDSPRIVAVMVPGLDKDAEIKRLSDELSALYERVKGLLNTISASEGNVNAAEGLVAEAQQAQARAEDVARQVQERLDAALAINPRARDTRRISSLVAAAARDAETIKTLRARLQALAEQAEALTARIKELEKPKESLGVHLRSSASDRQEMGCGCIIERTSTKHCNVPGAQDGHPFIVVAVTDSSDIDRIVDALSEVTRN